MKLQKKVTNLAGAVEVHSIAPAGLITQTWKRSERSNSSEILSGRICWRHSRPGDNL